MGIPLDEWDRKIAPVLEHIRVDQSWIQYHLLSCLTQLEKLVARPEWETRAQDEIDRSIKQFEVALAGLKRAKEIYLSKPATA